LITLGKWLERYFRGENPEVNFRLSPDGTAFQRQVWDLLRTIPYGTSITYGQLARHMSPSMSSQAVGQAVGKNPIPIVIPCHRVLGVHGKLTGYSAGLSSKVQLLELEGISYT
jgi:methylated-DNA-[protein]-cysteine S-methyltransferase